MHSVVVLALLAMLAGCTTPPQYRYWSTYRVEGTAGQLDGQTAEQRQRAAADAAMASAFSGYYDAPVKLIRAPQPLMPPEDTDNRVVGRVVVEMLFSEAGDVEQIIVVESTKDSLADSVRTAVQQWRITPATRAGKPSKVRARQVFSFKTDW